MWWCFCGSGSRGSVVEKRWWRLLRFVGFSLLLWVGACGGPLSYGKDQTAGPQKTMGRALPANPGIGLALSGGGYRASLHALGALRALHDAGLLDQVEIISSVSGGSLTAAYYVYGRARQGDDFLFETFQTDLLAILSSYELPRSVLAAELQEATSGAISGFSECVATRLGKVLLLKGMGEGKLWENLKTLMLNSDDERRSALDQCAEEAMEHVRHPDLARAINAYAGDRCDRDDPEGWMARCLATEDRTIAATVNSALVALVLDTGERGDVQQTFCILRQQLCQRPGLTLLPREPGLPAPHPMSELLHLSLFQPWTETQGAVRMADLDVVIRPHLVLNATSTHRGELWSASPRGAGVQERVSGDMEPSWTLHGDGRGPRLADAVAASACYPLFCRPVPMPWSRGRVEMLTDGGVYDNLGIRSLLKTAEDRGTPMDVLVIADAHRPYEREEGSTSRSGTVLRLIDMMLEQRSQGTLRSVQEQADKTGGCPPLHVSLARTRDTEELGALPTDLKPIKEGIESLLDESVKSFRAALRAHPCLGSGPGPRSD